MRKIICAILFPVAVVACGEKQGEAPKVGSDMDANGCKGSAGYSWCAKTERCERPWELAKAKGFDNSEAAFKDFCGN